jgi:asparagine synthase (glutamine-hydrolysing)
MCGIAGIISKSGRPLVNAPDLVASMLKLLSHRGPDGTGIWESDDRLVCFGHQRLAVIDLSNNASQPMTDPESQGTISYNGELFDHIERRDFYRKEGAVLRSNSDTEIFLKDFLRLGPLRFLVDADGMFSAAIYNRISKDTYLVIDRVGEKPLYYFEDTKALYFASELSALKPVLGRSRQFSEDALFLYFLLRYVPAPFTIYHGVKKLRPGSYLQVNPIGEVREFNYFEFQPDVLIKGSKENLSIALSRTKNELIRSLESRMLSDVPLGVLLSGGIDSTLISALLVKELGRKIDTFSVGFEDADSEHITARQTAERLGTNHHELIISQKTFQRGVDRAVMYMDEPNADRSCIPFMLLAEFAKQKVTVAIGGDGGDELFAGYDRYISFSDRYNSIRHSSPSDLLAGYLSTALPVVGFGGLFDIFGRTPELALGYLRDLSHRFCPPLSLKSSARFLDFSTYLPGAVLTKVDRMSMSVSLEVRTPFFSPDLIRTSSFLGDDLLYNGTEGKQILRRLLASYGFNSVANLPKRGFGTPPQFLIGDGDAFKRTLHDSLGQIMQCERLSFLRNGFKKYLKEAKQMNANAAWAIVVLGKWIVHEQSSHAY